MTFEIKYLNNKFVLTVLDNSRLKKVYYLKSLKDCSDLINMYISLQIDIDTYFRKRRKLDYYDLDFLKTFIKFKYCDLGIIFEVICDDEINYKKKYYFDCNIYFLTTVSKPTNLVIEFKLC